MYPRYATPEIREALRDTPVVLIAGPRQAGKSALVGDLLDEQLTRSYVTLEDAATLDAARNDPQGFIESFAGPVCIEEVQRAPEIFLPIKAAVDRKRTPGRFLLSASANMLALPTLPDSLAGRIQIIRVFPLAQSEIESPPVDTNFVGDLLAGTIMPGDGNTLSAETKDQFISRALVGGYPGAIAQSDPTSRRAWFASYIRSVLDRDLRDLSAIEASTAMPNLLALIAARSGRLTNYADLASSVRVSQPTVKRCVTLLEQLFLVHRLPAWFRNAGVQLTRSSKLYLADTGLAMHLLGIDADGVSTDPNLAGHLLENFVVLEILKLASVSEGRPKVSHFRTSNGSGVSVLLETARGDLAAVDVQASASVRPSDFNGIRTLAALVPERFKCGVVFYMGTDLVPFGSNLFAVPIARLWQSLRC